MVMEKRGKIIGVIILLLLAGIGWIVLFVQNPVILAKARWQYQHSHALVLEIDNHTVRMSPAGEIIVVQ